MDEAQRPRMHGQGCRLQLVDNLTIRVALEASQGVASSLSLEVLKQGPGDWLDKLEHLCLAERGWS